MSDTSLIFNVLAKDKASGTFKKVGAAAKVAMAVAAAAVIKFGVDSVQAYAEAEASQLKLTDAFAKFPALGNTNIERLRALNTELAKKTRFDDDATASGQASLAMFKFTGKQIEELTPLMQDFAAKTGMDLPAAAKIFGRAMLGQGRGLKTVGINFKDTGTEAGNYAQLMAGLQDKVGGFAEKEGKTAAGQAAILSNQFGELQEKVGGMLVPQLLRLVPVLQQTLSFLDRNATTIIAVVGSIAGLIAVVKLVTFAQKAWTAALVVWSVLQKVVTAGQWLWNIAMMANPIGLIILAVIALIAIVVLLWMKSAAFRNFFIGMWNHIWGFLKAIGAWFAGPFKDFFVRGWNNMVATFNFAKDAVIRGFNMVVDFVTGLPGRIASAASGMWNGLVYSFKAAINWLISLWNNFHLTLGGGSLFGMDIPSITLNTPDIPYLDTGGTISRTGVAVVHKGETVVPAGRNGGGGSAGVHFSGDVDSAFASAFMKLVRNGKITIAARAVV